MLHRNYMRNFCQSITSYFKGLLKCFCCNACGIWLASHWYVICNYMMYTTEVIQKSWWHSECEHTIVINNLRGRDTHTQRHSDFQDIGNFETGITFGTCLFKESSRRENGLWLVKHWREYYLIKHKKTFWWNKYWQFNCFFLHLL